MSSNTPPASRIFLRPQHNGWSPERRQRFLDHLALNGNVLAAARAAGMTKQSAYWLRALAAMPHDPEDDLIAPDWPLAPFSFAGG